MLASAALTVLFLPLTTATPEVRDPSEATAFVDGDSDYFEFAAGSSLMTGATWTLTGPGGASMTLTRTGTVSANQPTSFYLDGGARAGSTSQWTAAGNLDDAPADGTWTISIHGFYSAADAYANPSGNFPGPTLAVQGKAIHFGVYAVGHQTWNWHKTAGTWNEPSTVPLSYGTQAEDLPDEGPEEDPQFARFFASIGGPVSQSIPGVSDSRTVPAQDANTPPATIPATCTLGPCTAETPLVTPAQPVPETCVPPLVPLLCVGPFTIPAQDLGDAPAVCDAASQVCIGPFPVPSQDVVETEAVTVAFDFTGLDVLADPHAGELTAIGPFEESIPVPLIGDVPLTLCPATCPFPVLPEGQSAGALVVTVTVGSESEQVAIPLDHTV